MRGLRFAIIIAVSMTFCTCKMSAQDNELFEEYLSLFAQVQLTDVYMECDTIVPKKRHDIQSKHLIFLDKDMQGFDPIGIIPRCVFKMDKYYLATLVYVIEDTTALRTEYNQYAILYDYQGKIVNSYTLLEPSPENSNQDYIIKYYFKRGFIKQQFYGYYDIRNEFTNCNECIYRINSDIGSLDLIQERNYDVKSENLMVVW